MTLVNQRLGLRIRFFYTDTSFIAEIIRLNWA